MLWKILCSAVLISVVIGIVVEHVATGVQTRTISEVRRSALDCGCVAISGIVISAGNNKFIVKDNTGTAELSTCPAWYKSITLGMGEKVTVIGEALIRPTMSRKCSFVMSVYKILSDQGTIEIRTRPGKPPWLDMPVPTASDY